MRAVLIRTGSSPIHSSSLIHGSPKVSMTYHDSVTGILFPGKNNMNYQRSNSLHLEINDKMMRKKKNISSIRSIRRAYSETDMFQTVKNGSGYELTGIGSQSFPARIPEENEEVFDDEVEDGEGSVVLKSKGLDNRVSTVWPENDEVAAVDDELEAYSGGGTGIGRKVGGGNGGGGGFGGGIGDYSGDLSKICDYYQEMLNVNPGNSLMLRNYGKFLHEVVKDVVKAEEYYSRAILANPSDGEVLSMYGKLIWETRRDKSRAKSYFDQAVRAAPEDCFVMGSYAHFLWDAEVDEEDEEEEETDQVAKIMTSSASSSSSSALVEAF
ncbi:Tetratricopeptide repeat-containing domain [Macleaya cordata]|uniref:Tetratricopeptide repeat-containing domain n=1 Tax=Macleaya cordata TaxID=56857 RepID=A0A200PXI2_MACCD|nr:Tetratricopeptide repeat-containing domain [Macleaya cordata]